jgi:hypothetical protein
LHATTCESTIDAQGILEIGMCIPRNRRAVQAACSALLAAASLFAAIAPPTAMAAVRLVGNINAGGNPEAGFDNIGSGKIGRAGQSLPCLRRGRLGLRRRAVGA